MSALTKAQRSALEWLVANGPIHLFNRLLWPDATGSFGGNYVSDYAASFKPGARNERHT